MTLTHNRSTHFSAVDKVIECQQECQNKTAKQPKFQPFDCVGFEVSSINSSYDHYETGCKSLEKLTIKN